MSTTLLRKMDWQPGERLGRNEECTLEPWQPDVEVDKRKKHIKQKVGKATKPLVTDTKYLQEKHPVSLLGEYCSKKRRGAPMYELCLECGLDHKKQFLFKDQLVFAPPVSSGMSTTLLRKMDWQPGERLGRNEECTLEPWQPDVEVDKRKKHIKQKVGKATKPLVTDTKYLQGKHPVSLLGEICSKEKCDAPMYELCLEYGQDHKKQFLFKVTVNEVEYKPSVSCSSKKMAKALAAQTCLQALGILPKPDSKTVKKP